MSQEDNHLAVVGMACRYPGAADLAEFWAELAGGVEGISRFEDSQNTEDYVPARGVVDGGEWFDARFFGYTPGEALVIEPQHRVFLEAAWHALEHAGCAPGTYPGVIGLYAGMGASSYLPLVAARGPQFIDAIDRWIANGHDFLATRVAYKLGLTGPAFTVQSACSTSLVAVHLAGQALLFGECDVALAGGVSLTFPQRVGYRVKPSSTSTDGHCRPFDIAGDGTVPSDGVGVVVLKRLSDAIEDGDHIHAVIRGSAVNNDGRGKIGYTAPSVAGQAEVVRAAQAVAQVEPDTIGYVEAHGTGTPLGDPIEIAALTKVFGPLPAGTCLVGSIKGNIGHTDAAAGVAGLIKTVLAVEHGQVPPNLHFTEPNPQIDFSAGPFRVVTELTEWKSNGHPRRAGVSSLGVGGTNVHVVLEEAPPRPPVPSARPQQLLPVSAKSRAALQAAAAELAEYLRTDPPVSLDSVAYTLQAGREPHPYRRFVVAETAADAAAQLTSPAQVIRAEEGERPVVFMFTGHGAHHADMAGQLYAREPSFRADIDRCSAVAGLDLPAVMRRPEMLEELHFGHAALFAVEYAVARLWMRWGVQPGAVIGHSLGELAAACIAGVFDVEDALPLVIDRARAVEEMPPGRMVAAGMSAQDIEPRLADGLSVAVVNGPGQCVVSGPVEPAEALVADLTAQGIDARLLRAAYAGHSPLMAPILPGFAERVAHVPLSAPTVPYISNMTGQWVGAQVATPQYWVDQLSSPVRFDAGLATLLADPGRVLLEVGPGRTMATLARRHPDSGREHVIIQSLPHPRDPDSDLTALLTAAGRLWSAGAGIDWAGLHDGRLPYRTPLPLYPFERQRYFLDEGTTLDTVEYPRPELDEEYAAPSSDAERAMAEVFGRLLGIGDVGVHDNFFELGGDSLIAIRLLRQVKAVYGVEVPLEDFYQDPTVGGLARFT